MRTSPQFIGDAQILEIHRRIVAASIRRQHSFISSDPHCVCNFSRCDGIDVEQFRRDPGQQENVPTANHLTKLLGLCENRLSVRDARVSTYWRLANKRMCGSADIVAALAMPS